MHNPPLQPATTIAGSVLRVLTCGSVDDGKSTLLGRLLFDASLIPDDHLAALRKDSAGRPTGPEGLDFSLLVDGLAAEREQGITIDVAYRYFATPRRSFIVADTPGHEQYTRNMATGASGAEAAIVLVDARKGLLTQTRRHSIILSLMGVRQVALAINKMDLVDNDEAVFLAIAADFQALTSSLEIPSVTCIPLSALTGDNVARRSELMSWYRGPTLLDWLESAPSAEDLASQGPFRMPVQWVNRAGMDFRGVSGPVHSGVVRLGDRLASGTSRRESTVAKIVTMDGELPFAEAGKAVTLVMADDVDIGRGDLLYHPSHPPFVADQFAAKLVWLADEEMLPHRSYTMLIGTDRVSAEVSDLKYRINVDNLEKSSAKVLRTNEIAFCNFALSRPVAFDSYSANRATGAFIVIDKASKATVGAGTVDFPLQRSQNLRWQDFDITRQRRGADKGQQPAILWFTGLSGAGKSTLANLVERRLRSLGRHTYILDGDNVRHGLNKDLGFTDADRVENVRRVSEVARLMADAGLIVLVCLISPFEQERKMAREIAQDITFLEIFVDAPLAVCEQRDPKGLYARARAGQIRNFTGIGSRYEIPSNPDLRVRGDLEAPEATAEWLATEFTRRGL
jgi:bifunctional enzyme CysN/CysC